MIDQTAPLFNYLPETISRSEYNNERGFTYEKVYPEKVVSRSYKKDYVQPRRNQQPVEWQGGHDRTYSFSDRGQKNYTPKPVVKKFV